MSVKKGEKITVSTQLIENDINRLETAAKKRGLRRATLIRLWVLDKLNEEDEINGDK